jgi:hypothetical protein
MAKINYSSKAPQPAEPVKQGESRFYNMPDSTASNLVLDILGAGEDIADLPARKHQVSHNAKYQVMEDGNKRLVTMTNRTGTAEVTIELADIEKLTGSNKPAKKLFVLSLIKANEQAIHDGLLTQDYVSFPLKELVDIGFYSRLNSARAGFNAGADILTSFKAKGRQQKSKKSKNSIESLEVLFTGAKIKNGQCYIYFNPRISWGFFAQYFTIIPRYYFKLPSRASDLLYYIFFLARQHTQEIEEKGYFTIGFRAIQHKLQLPSEKGLNNPQRDIKDKIEEAITQIEDEHNNTYGNIGFKLLPDYDEGATIGEYLDNGYLKVSLEGEFAKMFIQISLYTKKQIKQAEQRKARIAEKAIAIKTAQGMNSPRQQG